MSATTFALFMLLVRWCSGLADVTEAPKLAVQRRPSVIEGINKPKKGVARPACIASAQQPVSWQHRAGWSRWSVPGVIKRCDGAVDDRLWYSIPGGDSCNMEDQRM